MNIPIIVVCYNNYKYVENTLSQILKINKEYYKNIQILNNNSTCLETKKFLDNVNVKVIHNNGNHGPWISKERNQHIYVSLPDKFILTDPDLKFNDQLPINFIDILSELSDKYNTYKIGFALDISELDKIYNTPIYYNNDTIYNWEKVNWVNKINDDKYELYSAGIDTTFCLVNKHNPPHNYLRIAGNFTAKHIPWYIDNEIYSVYENYITSKNATHISSISSTIKSYVENKYTIVYKQNELFLIQKNDSKLPFWIDTYPQWQNDLYHVFDSYLSTDKIYIDIGSWIGTSVMYAARKSKHVYAIESNPESFRDLQHNCKTNCSNYTLMYNAIFNKDTKLKFGKNLFDISMNFTSHNDTANECYEIESITLQTMINKYNINICEISLINLDIVGGEENILDDLFYLHTIYKMPLYIHFYYSWWKDKNIDRFSWLTHEHKQKIIENPFTSILFQ
jgi:FkbM family methyltransferase